LDAIGYADTADKASKADASGVLAADLPEIDPVTKHAGKQDAIAAMEAVVIADTDKPSEWATRRGHERAQNIAEREALEELAAEAKAAAAKAKRKSTKQMVQEGSTSRQEMFDVGEGVDIEAHTSDSWGIVGRDVSIPNVEMDAGGLACAAIGTCLRTF
jgi:hypothetical protein